MTNPSESPSPAPQSAPAYTAPASTASVTGTARSLAAAVAVFLGGYLLLRSLNGALIPALSNVLPVRASLAWPAPQVALEVLQFLFAIVVVVVGLLLVRGPLAGRAIGALIVVAGVVALAVFLTFRAFGPFDVPVPPDLRIPFTAFAANAWFWVVLLVGIAWLLSRSARLGWLALLGVLVLIPVPTALLLSGAESAVVGLVMYAIAAIVGAALIAAGRPLRE